MKNTYTLRKTKTLSNLNITLTRRIVNLSNLKTLGLKIKPKTKCKTYLRISKPLISNQLMKLLNTLQVMMNRLRRYLVGKYQ
jgi:hypothetical protein